MPKLIPIFLLLTWLSGTTPSVAQPNQENDLKLSNLQRIDEIYLEHKRELATDISFNKLQKIVRGDIRDLATIQSLFDNQLVGPAEDQELLALGVLLGDIFVKENNMQWQVYEDNLGRSRAVCLPRSSHCLFPITMISKRIKRGADINVEAIYNRGIMLIKDYIPKLPYSVKK